MNFTPCLRKLFARPAIVPKTGFRAACQRRLAGGERLETRAMLAANALSPWQNPTLQHDVNADGRVTAGDALAIVNELNRFGARSLDTGLLSGGDLAPVGASSSVTRASFMTSADEPVRYYDVNGDQRISSMDLLAVINRLNAQAGELARVRVQPVDMDGNPITSVLVGQSFKLQALAQDLRSIPNAEKGVYNAFFDVDYSANRVALQGQVVFDGDFDQFITSDIATAGVINETGAARSGTTPPGGAEQLVFTTTFKATAAGTVAFTPNIGEDPNSEIGLYGIDDPIQTMVEFVASTLEIIATSPIARDDAYPANGITPTEDGGPYNLPVTGNDDVHPNGEGPLTITSFSQGSMGGTVSAVQGNVSLLYKPAANFFGSETFTYTIRDANNQTATATVTIGVASVNDPPPKTDDTFAVDAESTGNVLDVLANDAPNVDPGETLTITAVSTPNNGGTVSITNAGARLTYSPAPGFAGTETFTYTISDGAGGTATANVTVHVQNDRPIAAPDNFNAVEDSTNNALDVLDNDSLAPGASGTLSVAAVTQGSNGGTVALGPGGLSVVYSPAPNFFGTETFTYTLTDGTRQSTGNVTVQVSNTNDNPTATADVLAVAEDSTDNPLDVLANDTIAPDAGETLTITNVTSAAHGTVSIAPNNRSLIYSPNANYNGPDTFSYTISDGAGGTSQATVSLTVTSVNDPPPVANDTAAVVEDSTDNLLDVLANDLLLPNPDAGETLTISAVGPTDNGGTVTIAANKLSLRYTPAANFAGTETFTYTVSDGKGGASQATVTITVSNTNDPPPAVDDTFNVDEKSVNNPLNVLANDAPNPDAGETLTISAVTAAANGTVSIAPNNLSLIYTPNSTFAGSDTFTYTVSDGNGGSRTATVTVNVANVNDPPTAGADSFTVAEDSQNNSFDVLANDSTAPDVGETLTITNVSATSQGGTVSIDGGNRLRYTPRPNFFGTETFRYAISDGNGGVAQGNVTVNVTNVNDNPTATADALSVAEDSVGNALNVLANDNNSPDPAGETLTITAVGPTNRGGTVTIANGGAGLVYTPAANFFGLETFTYTISDGNGGTATATVTVNVTNVNDNPTATADSFTVTKNTAANRINVLANDSNAPDLAGSETLVVTGTSTPTQGGTVSIAPGGAGVLYTPAPDFVGTETFTYTVSDGNGGSASQTVTVTVLDYIPGSLSGYVYVDTNNSGGKDILEKALVGVTLRLSGTNQLGAAVDMLTQTDAAGFYMFANLIPGQYTITEVGPEQYIDGLDAIGSQGGLSAHDQFFIQLANGMHGTNNNFGERGLKPEYIGRPDFFFPR